MITLKSETTYVLEYNELDKIINENFPNFRKEGKYYTQEFECVADQEWNNDESHSISFKKEPLNRWDQENVDCANRGEYKNYMLWDLMQDLVNRDILPEGKYRIDISW